MLALAAFFLAACAQDSSTAENPADSFKPELVGRIASVSPDGRFVLVQSYGTWRVESGSTLTTRGPEDRTANLLVTGEKLGQYAAADLRSGLAAAGDAVYFLPQASASTASSPPTDIAADTHSVNRYTQTHEASGHLGGSDPASSPAEPIPTPKDSKDLDDFGN